LIFNGTVENSLVFVVMLSDVSSGRVYNAATENDTFSKNTGALYLDEALPCERVVQRPGEEAIRQGDQTDTPDSNSKEEFGILA
jgi:hypothetical protein